FLRDALPHARALRVRPASSRPVGAGDDPAGPRRLAVRRDEGEQQGRYTDHDEGVGEVEGRPVAKVEEVRDVAQTDTVEEVRDAPADHEPERNGQHRMS